MIDDIKVGFDSDNASEYQIIINDLSNKTCEELSHLMANSLDELLSKLQKINPGKDSLKSKELSSYTLSVALKFCMGTIATAGNNFIKEGKKSIFIKTIAEKFYVLIRGLDKEGKDSYV
jgi:hypothetical protein